jgi:hypothetical protein
MRPRLRRRRLPGLRRRRLPVRRWLRRLQMRRRLRMPQRLRRLRRLWLRVYRLGRRLLPVVGRLRALLG